MERRLLLVPEPPKKQNMLIMLQKIVLPVFVKDQNDNSNEE